MISSQPQLQFRPGSIQRQSPIPLYAQLSEEIKQAIAAGELRPGHELPTEAQLCELYGVSRITVRKTLADLEADGLVARTKPRGPLVVSRPRIKREVGESAGLFVEGFLQGGVHRETRVLLAAPEQASPHIADRLQVEIGDPVYRVDRLHLGDGEPLAYQISWLAAALVPDLLEYELSGSLQRLCEEHYGHSCERKIQRISARTATPIEAEYLGLHRKSPVLEIERTLLLGNARPLEYLTYALVPDRFTIVSEIVRPPERSKRQTRLRAVEPEPS